MTAESTLLKVADMARYEMGSCKVNLERLLYEKDDTAGYM